MASPRPGLEIHATLDLIGDQIDRGLSDALFLASSESSRLFLLVFLGRLVLP